MFAETDRKNIPRDQIRERLVILQGGSRTTQANGGKCIETMGKTCRKDRFVFRLKYFLKTIRRLID
jgi:hypothetical protein